MTKVVSYTEKAAIVPHSDSDLSKKEQVTNMFDHISGTYDFLNHFLSLGIDKTWRRKAINAIKDVAPKQILDVATGTGDLAIEAVKLNPDLVTGVDISEGMLEMGKRKITKMGLENKINCYKGDSENLNFPDGYFDAVTCAYGVRNFENLQKGLKEMSRVLRAGGKIAILEFSHPKTFPIKQLYHFYFRFMLPAVGKVVSKDQTAYTYLPESVAAFPEGKEFCELLKKSGFTAISAQPLAFGITTLYIGLKA